MSSLLPQFKSFTINFKTLHHQSHTHLCNCAAKLIHFRAQCIMCTSSQTSTTVLDVKKLKMASLEANSNSISEERTWKLSSTVLDIEKLKIPSLETCSNSIPANKQWMYNGGVGPPKETNFEEALIVAASAEAITLAKAALKGAKDAAKLARNSNHTPPEISPEYSLTEETDPEPEPGPSDEELEILQALEKSLAVRSNRQIERKERRARGVEKEAANIVTVKSGLTNRKKSTLTKEIDFSDPLRFLRGTSSKLLTASEEQKLSAGIQDLLKLERLEDELALRCGTQPTFGQWAAVAGVDQITLRKRLSYGILCKDKMINSNVRLVISIAKNYQGSGMNLQDLVQEGCRGLIRGAEKFDATKGFKFSTYAHWWIKQAVRKSLSDQSRMIRLPFHMVEATYRVKEARKHLFTENGKYPNDEEIIEATGLSMKRLQAVMLTPKAPRSLDQKIGINLNLKPSDVISDPEAETSEEILIKKFMREDLEKVLDSLNVREKQVIRWRFGLEDGRMKTLQEIGELMSVSRERIRQIESCAFRKLKNKKKNKHLLQYVMA